MCHPDRPWPVSGGSGVTSEWIEIDRDSERIPAWVAQPESKTGSGVLIIHDVHGANEFYQDLAIRLAEQGYQALLPDYFFRLDPAVPGDWESIRTRAGKLDERILMSDIRGTLEWLIELQLEDPKIGLIGFCMGGTLAFLAAARHPLPDATVAYYGFPQGRQGWEHKPIDEVERVESPILALWGDADAGVGMDNANAYSDAMERAEKEYEAVIYPSAPHGFLTFDPESPNFAAASDSWVKTLTFLEEKLG